LKYVEKRTPTRLMRDAREDEDGEAGPRFEREGLDLYHRVVDSADAESLEDAAAFEEVR